MQSKIKKVKKLMSPRSMIGEHSRRPVTAFQKDPDFETLSNVARCQLGHNPRTAEFNPRRKCTTSTLSQSADNGCPWCGIFWTAVKQACHVEQAGETDYLFWRNSHESFFEPHLVMDSVGDFQLQIYTTSATNEPFSPLMTKSLLPASTASTSSLHCLRRWIEMCVSQHSRCIPKVTTATKLPTRVIDIGAERNEDWVQLIETQDMYAPYFCLSHCWGVLENPFTTTTANLKFRKQGIELAAMPKTFRDAIDVARNLGAKYLWIDSLCIIQDDAHDWEVEASQMANIYRNSQLTIAAAAAEDDEGGLFCSSSTEISNHAPLMLEAYRIPFPLYARKKPQFQVGHVMQNQGHQLLTRAWVMQERMLSPRIAYFGHQEVAWECMKSTACECEPTLQSHPDAKRTGQYAFHGKGGFSGMLSYDSSYQSPILWHRIVETYTALGLTKWTDKLIALSGLATAVNQSRTRDEYIAGLWQSTLPVDMLWQRTRAQPNVLWAASWINQPIAKWPAECVVEYVAPTWSWASVPGSVQFHDMEIHDPQFVKFKEFGGALPSSTNPASSPSFDPLYMILTGKLVQVELRLAIVAEYVEYRLWCKENTTIPFDADYMMHRRVVPRPNSTEHNLRPKRQLYAHGSKLFCLQVAAGRKIGAPKMMRIHGVVLGLVESGNYFQRVGVFEETFEVGKEASIFESVVDEVDVKIL